MLHGVAIHAYAHARVDESAERLRQHADQPSFGQADGARPLARRGKIGVEGHDRVDADQQFHAFLERDGGVQRVFHRAVDVVAPLDPRGRIEPGQRRARLHRLGDRNVVMPRRAERDGAAAIEVGGEDQQLALELAEVVGSTALTE